MAAATVTLLSSGTQAQSGTGSAVDVSNNAQIRQQISATVDFGKGPVLNVWFDTAPASTGPWTEIAAVKMNTDPPTSPYAWDVAKRVVLAAADQFLRVRWDLAYTRNTGGAAPTFALGVAGTGIVSA